ncbi:MAG TPA: ATP-binding protein [Chloroflexota bacterium]|nr:ATP-binding protein [Chloroflexota bacterium]
MRQSGSRLGGVNWHGICVPKTPKQAPVGKSTTNTDEVLKINARLRHALDRLTEREATIRALADHNAELYQQVHDSHRQLVAAQRQLIQQERLRALGEMASGVAHDLNNALAPVLGFTELLVHQPDARADPDRLLHYLRLILTGATDAAAVVKRLREFYRPRAEDEQLAAVDLNALVKQTIALSEPKWRGLSAEGRSISVRTDLSEIPPAAGHATELRELLMNLLFNAVDACPDGGTITVRTHVRGGTCLTLEVEDTGTGMTEEVRQRCLEPFFTTKGEHGTGMGMAMVYGTVTRHDGSLEIESAPGEGTTVSVHLPQYGARAGAQPNTSNTGASAYRSALHVLVADDEPLLRTLVSEFLTALGHTADLAASGDEAWQRFHQGAYDLVITDRAMPGMSGEQLAQRVKAHRPTTPVVLLTGFGDLLIASGQRPDGVDVVLGKPVSLAALRSGIADALGSGSQVRAA